MKEQEAEVLCPEFRAPAEGRAPPGFIVGDDGPFVPRQVAAEERACIDALHALRAPDGRRSAPFALAFSGGGIRAAAFQSGVLWRLATMGYLKDVEYLAAVSGGAYIASAFVSHCVAANPPRELKPSVRRPWGWQHPPAPDEGSVNEWYLEVVAKTLFRMYDNAGDFVRDCVKGPIGPAHDSGCLPRACDVPVLLLVISMTMLCPLLLVIVVMTPLTACIEFFFGGAMRAAYCAPPGVSWVSVLQQWTPIQEALRVFGAALATTFAVFVLRRVVSALRLGQHEDGRPRASRCFLFGHSVGGFLTRFTAGTFFAIVFLLLVPALQTALYSVTDAQLELRRHYCQAYIQGGPLEQCSDRRHGAGGAPWFATQPFAQAGLSAALLAPAETEALEVAAAQEKTYNLLHIFVLLTLVVLVLALCCVPFVGAELLTSILRVLGPLFLSMLLLSFVQHRIYGPIMLQSQGAGLTYDQESWDSLVQWALRAALLVLPFYEEMRSLAHVYYARCLRQNFLAGGKDVCLRRLASHAYCPFLILTGTANDFMPPGNVKSISELSFTALHCGSLETGYVATPAYRSLAKCTALSGAGALDAVALSMSKALSLRFWLQVLNLSWGDYIIFEGRPLQLMDWMARCLEALGGPGLAAATIRLMRRLPGVVLCWTFIVIITRAWQRSREAGPAACADAERMYLAAILLGLVVFFLSFFTFLPILEYLGLMPLLRQIHQATMFYYIGDVCDGIAPPCMLYVTDGGVKDWTAVVQLMQRRCARILLVMADTDPHTELLGVRALVEIARKQRLCSLFDAEDPRSDLDSLFERYKNDSSMPYMHVGILYGWDEDGAERLPGNLFIVKNRLPPDHVGEALRPGLTEEEIRTGRPPPGCDGHAAVWKGMTTDELGPIGCCDCCHTNGLNCGPKFPHGTFTGYVYLSPQWCASLSRLAFDVSGPAVEAMMSLA